MELSIVTGATRRPSLMQSEDGKDRIALSLLGLSRPNYKWRLSISPAALIIWLGALPVLFSCS
jgi:hypothetical protein